MSTACLPLLQLTGTVPAFLANITSLVEMELESNKVYCLLATIALAPQQHHTELAS